MEQETTTDTRLDRIIDHVRAEGGGAAPAILFGDDTWTFDDLAKRARSIGSLAACHAPPGGTIAVIGENHPDWVAAYYGIPGARRVTCFLNHRLAPAEIAAQIDRAGSSMLLCTPGEHARLMSSIPAGLPVHHFGDRIDELPEEPTSSSGDDVAWLLFTSGTTGSPKGALLSHTSVLAALDAGAIARPIASDEVFAFPFPLCHVAGYNVLRLHQHGRPVVLLDRFEPRSFLDAIARHKVTSASLAATMLASLLDHLNDYPGAVHQLATIRSLSYGASPMPVELLERVSGLLDVDLSQGYGMTELSGNAVFLDANDHRRGLESDPTLLRAAGRPGIGVAVEVRDPTGRPVAVGTSGEIWVKGAQVMVGYLDDEDTTARTIVDGWLATGDGGRWRADGILEVVDRLKDVIVTGGENVASLEVERAIRTTFDEVVDVAVIGVPDPTWGENVCAVIVERSPGEMTIDRLAEGLSGVLAGFKIPRHLVVVDALPLTHSGKAAKATLRMWLADEPDHLGPRRSRDRSS